MREETNAAKLNPQEAARKYILEQVLDPDNGSSLEGMFEWLENNARRYILDGSADAMWLYAAADIDTLAQRYADEIEEM